MKLPEHLLLTEDLQFFLLPESAGLEEKNITTQQQYLQMSRNKWRNVLTPHQGLDLCRRYQCQPEYGP